MRRRSGCNGGRRGNAAEWAQLENIFKYLEVKMDSVLNHVKAVKAAFDDAILLTKDNRIPPGLRKALRDSFKCRICLNTMAPP